MTLDEPMAKSLAIKALQKWIGSMEFIDSLLLMEDEGEEQEMEAAAVSSIAGTSQEASSVQSPGGSIRREGPLPEWCKCRNCVYMPLAVENKCCGNRNCVTLQRRFSKLCLDPDVLQLCVVNRADIRNDRQDNSTRSFRKAAYRQYILDRHGYLGKGNRKVAPSCVVTSIRRQYPSSTGVYMGYREH